MIIPPTVFVGGPIQYAIHAKGFDPTLRTIVIQILDCFEGKGFQVLSAHRYERFGEVDTSGMHLEVARRDYDWMAACDVFVAVLPDDADGRPMRTDGTCVELGWASGMGRSIVVVRNLEQEHSHLVKGIGVVANCIELDIRSVVANPATVVEAASMLLHEVRHPSRVNAVE